MSRPSNFEVDGFCTWAEAIEIRRKLNRADALRNCQACINREAGLSSVHEPTVQGARRVFEEKGGKYPAFKYTHTCGGDQK